MECRSADKTCEKAEQRAWYENEISTQIYDYLFVNEIRTKSYE